ncbi:MAG: hypothetical protein QGG40_14800, partial [Myxococcota bacterium]|nr:hypothetical protein [Myxococcota bacterium]
LALLVTPSEAANCSFYVSRAKTAEGDYLAKTYRDLARCDAKLAEGNFNVFLKNATDADTLVKLSLAAIEADTWTPVWKMLGKITDYDARDEVAERIGVVCSENDKVVTFLQSAYFGVKSTDYQPWSPALTACKSTALQDWMNQTVQAPPETVYDDKYNALLDVFVDRMGPEALPLLAKGAVEAANNGPFETLLVQMEASVAPGLGGDMTEENRQALEGAMIEVAQAVTPEQARAVADRLANSGSDAAAAKLLPQVFPERVQSDGTLIYGGAVVETADCKGKKTAVIHFATVSDPGTRWNVFTPVSEAMTTLKPKLSKCESLGDWAVVTTPEPVQNGGEVQDWADGLKSQWENNEYSTSLKSEKDVVLQ